MAKVYIIPENFIEGGRILNLFSTRNFIEAVCLTLLVGVPLWMIPYPSFQIKIMVVLCVAAPIFMITATGINGDSIIQFIQQYRKWKKSKRIMLYNAQARPREVRAADVIMAQEQPKDKIVEAVETWQEKRKQKNADIDFVEGRDFVFLDDEEGYSSYVATEKKLLNSSNKQDEPDAPKAEKKPKRKRRRNNRNTKLLTATSSTGTEPSQPENPPEKSLPDEDIIMIDNNTDEDSADIIIEGEVITID